MKTQASRSTSVWLIGDAGLLTAAAFCVLAIVAGPSALLIGPVIAWLLHGHRLDGTSLACGAIGMGFAALVIGGMFVLASSVAAVGNRFVSGEYGGAIALLAAADIVLIVLIGILDTDAIVDLTSNRRQHVNVDIARIASSCVVLLFVVTIIVLQTRFPESEIGDALVFLLAAAATGSMTMLDLQMVQAFWFKRNRIV